VVKEVSVHSKNLKCCMTTVESKIQLIQLSASLLIVTLYFSSALFIKFITLT